MAPKKQLGRGRAATAKAPATDLVASMLLPWPGSVPRAAAAGVVREAPTEPEDCWGAFVETAPSTAAAPAPRAAAAGLVGEAPAHEDEWMQEIQDMFACSSAIDEWARKVDFTQVACFFVKNCVGLLLVLEQFVELCLCWNMYVNYYKLI